MNQVPNAPDTLEDFESPAAQKQKAKVVTTSTEDDFEVQE